MDKNYYKSHKATEILGKHYQKLFEANGANAKGVGWGDPSKHLIRINSMLSMVEKRYLSKSTLLDVGCGYGELYNFLKERKSNLKDSYVGFDINDKMIGFARENNNNNEKFHVSNIDNWNMESAIVFCCGIFTKKVDADNEDMEKLLDSFFEMCLRIKAKQIIFNTMSPLCDYLDKSLYYPKVDIIINLISKYLEF